MERLHIDHGESRQGTASGSYDPRRPTLRPRAAAYAPPIMRAHIAMSLPSVLPGRRTAIFRRYQCILAEAPLQCFRPHPGDRAACTRRNRLGIATPLAHIRRCPCTGIIGAIGGNRSVRVSPARTNGQTRQVSFRLRGHSGDRGGRICWDHNLVFWTRPARLSAASQFSATDHDPGPSRRTGGCWLNTRPSAGSSCRFAAIPKPVINAFISAEDKNFYSHHGIDPLSILRAAMTDIGRLRTSRRPIGASTITQQVAKNMLLTNEVSIARKIRRSCLLPGSRRRCRRSASSNSI